MMRVTGSKYCAMLAMALGLMACSRGSIELDNTVVQNPENTMTVLASIGESSVTRTSLQKNMNVYDVVWDEGDVILIGGKEFTLVGEGGSTYGEFAGPQLEDGEYDAYFATADGNIPTAQTFIAGRISNAPMSAKLTVSGGEPGPVSFKNLGGLLRITVKNIQKAHVKSIAISVSEGTSSMRFVLACGDEGVELSEDGTEFYVALPEGLYGGVSIEVSDGNKTVTKTLSTKMGIVRSKITDAVFSVLFEGNTYRTYHMGHEYVDLGLQSGLMWSACNLGADEPWEGGSVCTWSEADVDWGGDWRLPTLEEMNELLTTFEWKATVHQDHKEVTGYLIGNKGKRIFFPYLTYESEFSYIHSDVGYYWSSSFEDDGSSKAPYVMVLSEAGGSSNRCIETYPVFHFSVRPVFKIK